MASKKSGSKPATGPRLVRGDEQPPPRVLRPCVVLAQADQPLPDTLHQALLEAGLSPRVEHDPRMAMAEVCLLRREARQRRGAGGNQTDAAPLVMIAEAGSEASNLLQAMQQHVPDIPVLRFDGQDLRSMHEPPPATPDPPVVVQPPHTQEVNEEELATLLSGVNKDKGHSR
ncbi:MAG: hypothetical protein QF733_00370 [Phycisphaerales bacterium]|jgi:hypothetical protein|nr:hypothetical protein [Phycisphaerales bacterium]